AIALRLKDDQVAFADLFDRYRVTLARVIAKVIGPDDPALEDLVQVTFFKAFRVLKRYRPERPFRTWICRIARNVAIDHNRRTRLDTVPLEDYAAESTLQRLGLLALQLRDHGETPVQEFEDRELGKRINEAIAQVPYRRTLCFIYYYVDGMTWEEIAYIFDITAAAAKKRSDRFRHELQELLEPAMAG